MRRFCATSGWFINRHTNIRKPSRACAKRSRSLKRRRAQIIPIWRNIWNVSAAVYEEAGDYASAEPLYRRSLDISDRALADMLTIGSERNKAAVLANLDDPIPRLIAFQSKARSRGGAGAGL